MSSPYLAAAYAFVWVTFILYEWSLSRRRARVLRELRELQALRERAQDLRSSEVGSP